MRFVVSSFILIWSFSLTVFCQKDSLFLRWQNENLHDTIRTDALYQYSWKIRNANPDSSLHYGFIALEEAQNSNYHRGIDNVLNLLGICYLQKSMMDSAAYYFNLAFFNAKSRSDYKRMGNIKVNIATIYGMQDQLMRAIDEINEGITYLEMAKDTTALIKAKSNLGICYRKLGDLDKAMSMYVTALHDSKKYNMKESQSLACNNIANIFKIWEQYDSALHYSKLALPYNIESNNLQGQARVYQNMASIFILTDHRDSAFYYSHLALHIQNNIGDLFGISGSYDALASAHLKFGKIDSAIYYGKKSIELSSKLNAIENLQDAHRVLYSTYEKIGDYKSAIFHLKTYYDLADSIKSDENLKALAQQEAKYDYLKKNLEDSLRHHNELKQLELEKEQQEIVSKETNRRNRIIIFSIIAVLAIASYALFILFKSNRQKKADNETITRQKDEVEKQKHIVEEKNAEITDSINYAKRIQNAILPPVKYIQQELPDSFVLYLPKDIVAGDFYWAEKNNQNILLAVADCTGHGVPGALVSVVCYNALNRSVREFKLNQTNEILDKTRELVIDTFEKSEEQVKDGMDISLISFNKETKFLSFSGANNPLWVVRPSTGSNANDSGLSELIELKADKQPIGKFENAFPFTIQNFQTEKNDLVILFSDGFADQFGGENGKKLKYKTLKEFLIQNASLPMNQLQNELQKFFHNWKGSLEQVDDVCVIGVRV